MNEQNNQRETSAHETDGPPSVKCTGAQTKAPFSTKSTAICKPHEIHYIRGRALAYEESSAAGQYKLIKFVRNSYDDHGRPGFFCWSITEYNIACVVMVYLHSNQTESVLARTRIECVIGVLSKESPTFSRNYTSKLHQKTITS